MIGPVIAAGVGVLFIYAVIDAYYSQPSAIPWLIRGWYRFVDRLPIVVVITSLTLLQLLIGAKTLSDSRAEEITTAFDFGIVVFGPYKIIGALLIIWLFTPVTVRTLKYLYMTRSHSDEFLADYWGETA